MAKANEAKQLEAAIAPVVAFNKLVVKSAENAINLQFDSFKAFADLGLKNLNAGFEVRDADDLKAYAEKQKDLAQKITERVTADAKAYGELNTQFIDEARTLAEQNVKSVSAQAKTA